MNFTETTGTPITQLKQFESCYTYSSETSEIVPLKGEVCVIYVPKSTEQLPNFPFPQNFRCFVSLEGAVKTRQDEYLIKVGNGKNTLGSNNLPWAAYPQNNDVEYWDYFFAKWFCSLGDVLVPTGQLYLINVQANTTSDPNLPLPEGAENLSKDCLYLKIGMGNTPLKKLPWIGVTNIEIVKNSIDTYLGSGTGIGQIENITENYLDSEAGIGQVEGITEGYLDSTAGAGQINKISLKFLDTEDAKKKLDIQTNQYIRSSKGTSQINGIISNYLTNGGYDDEDIGDGLIINCN